MARRKLVEVGGKEADFGRRDGQLALLGARGSSNNTDNISTAEVLVVRDEVVGIFGIPVVTDRQMGARSRRKLERTYCLLAMIWTFTPSPWRS